MAPSTRGKEIDRSTNWSKGKWDETRELWYTSRRNESGEDEYYWYPAETTSTTEDSSIPRSFGQTASDAPDDSRAQSYYPPVAEAGEARTSYSQVTTSSYRIPTTSGPATYVTTPSYTTAITSANTAIDPYDNSSISYPTSSLDAGNAVTSSESSEFNIASDPNTRTGYQLNRYTSTTISPYDTNDSSSYYQGSGSGSAPPADSLVYNMRSLNLGSQATLSEQGQFETPSAELQLTGIKNISQTSGTGSYEELDPRYQIVADQRWFWRVGRVFMMLWTEPAQQKVGPEGGTRNGSHYSTTWLNEMAYSEIRRFVVIREGHGNNLCSPIHTYSKQATLKPNLPERQQHAIIYTSDRPPAECSYSTSDGRVIKENLSKDPIKVKREQRDREGDLGPYSRINYSKVYTVEGYVRVLNIGMVDKKSLDSLVANSYVRIPTTPIERPTRYEPPADRERRHSKDKHNSRGKGRPSEHGGRRRR